MSIPNRIYRISRAYLDQIRDRIDAELTEREKDLAERELDAEPGQTVGGSSGGGAGRPAMDDNSPEALMRRAEERIAAARRAAESHAELDRLTAARAAASAAGQSATTPDMTTTVSTPASASTDPNASDYRVLNLEIGSDLAAVQTQYEKLARRCDPGRFPDGSQEQKDAERILARVNAAYESLRKRLDPTENRFGKLELE